MDCLRTRIGSEIRVLRALRLSLFSQAVIVRPAVFVQTLPSREQQAVLEFSRWVGMTRAKNPVGARTHSGRPVYVVFGTRQTLRSLQRGVLQMPRRGVLIALRKRE
jgi:hypothetical protein